MSATAQIKVDSNGDVAIGTPNTSSNYKLNINGGLKVYGGNIYFDPYVNYNSFTIKEDSYGNAGIIPWGNNSCTLGSSSYQFNRIYSKYIYPELVLVTSDKRLKTNDTDIDGALDKIKNLQGKKYDYKTEYIDTIKNEKIKADVKRKSKDRLGFFAQDVMEIIPEAVVYEEENDTYYMDYNAIIPVLVEALKEQQTQIDFLQNQIDGNKLKSANLGNTNSSSLLNQNSPNPFSVNTTISYQLDSNAKKSVLYIFNMSGGLIDTYTLAPGSNQIIIEGNSMTPGMYIYTLVCDGKEMDSKRMILTK